MLLAIDIGNSNIVIGCMNGTKIEHEFRIATDHVKTSDQYCIDLKNVLSLGDMPETELTALLSARCARFPKLAAEELLTGLLQSRLGKTLVRRAGLDAEKPLEAVTAAERLAVGRLVKCCAVEAVGVLGMDSAQVTAGGLRTEEFDPETLESRVVPGLYACGEVLDVDGDCGGFNLQWAWSSGHLSGLLL